MQSCKRCQPLFKTWHKAKQFQQFFTLIFFRYSYLSSRQVRCHSANMFPLSEIFSLGRQLQLLFLSYATACPNIAQRLSFFVSSRSCAFLVESKYDPPSLIRLWFQTFQNKNCLAEKISCSLSCFTQPVHFRQPPT